MSENISNKNVVCTSNTGGVFYALGILGAGYYYLQDAQSFMQGAIGVLKAVIWPAVTVYEVFTRLGL